MFNHDLLGSKLWHVTPTVCSGYCIDILNQLATMEGFTYEIAESPDAVYGQEVSPGVFNGLIGQAQFRSVDAIVGAITVTGMAMLSKRYRID